MEEDYPDTEADGPNRSLPYTDGETGMVMIKDGGKDCWAMLVSQEMVDHINFAKQQSRAIEKRESAVDEAATEVVTIQVSIEEVEDKVDLAGAQETGQLREELGRLGVMLRQAKDRRVALQENIESYQSGFICSKSTTQRMVEDALEEAGLLDPPEPDSPPSSTAGSMDETAEYGEDTAPSNDNESIATAEAPTEEELLRRAACEDWDKSRRAQRDAQIAFDGRQESYGQMNFDRHRGEGRMDYTRSEFDVEHEFEYVQQLTRSLREADEWVLRAQLNCQALEIRTDPDISYSDYSEYMDLDGNGDDGSWIDQEDSPKMLVKRGDIEAWTNGVWENQDPDMVENYDPVSFDEWDRKPDDPMDSNSVLDCDRWVVEIGRWQEQCAHLRDGQLKGPLPEDVWSVNMRSGFRRRSV